MSPIYKWWNWCTESFGHMFAGVTAPILLLSAVVVLVVANSGGGDDGLSPSPPRSDVAGVCMNATPASDGSTDCDTSSETGLSVQTPTPVPPSPTPKPRTYTVRAGDALSIICASEAPDMALDDCIAAIVELSDLSGPDEITEGQVLQLPPADGRGVTTGTSSRRTPTPVVTQDVDTAQAEEPADEPTAEPTPHASLVAIGPEVAEDEVGVPPEDDETVIPEDEPEMVEEEPEVVEEETEVPEEEEATPTDEELAANQGAEYTVEDGDSLSGICASQVAGMSDEECVDFVVLLNDLGGPDEIYAGQVLYLP